MWKQGGRSAALDRAQALLGGKRSSGGAAEPVRSARGSAAQPPAPLAGAAPPHAHTFLSDLSELSSVSSAPGRGEDTGGPAAAVDTQGRDWEHPKDLRPASPLGGEGGGGGGGGSRFLKKAQPTAASSSQSPVSRKHPQQERAPRYVSSSQRGSQTAALSRLAQIESRIRGRKQAQEHMPKPARNLTSDYEMSPPPPAAPSLEAPVQSSAPSSGDQSLKGRRFLKNQNSGAADSSTTAAPGPPVGPDAAVRSRAAAAAFSSAHLETKAASGVSLESDEEDMKKLLGVSLDSMDNSFVIPRRPSSRRAAAKMLSRNSQRDLPTPLSSPAPPPPCPASASPRSPRRGSPFRFSGQAQAHFSPSVPSSCPSPGRVDSPRGALSPQRSLSSSSGRAHVLSLGELFPVGRAADDPHSDMSSVLSDDFKINVMTLDDLVPADPGVAPEEEREARHSAPVPAPPSRYGKQASLKKEQQEEVLDYHSDFESESRTEADGSASQVSEHLLGRGEEEVSEVREEASGADVSCGRTREDHSSAFSHTSCPRTSLTSDGSRSGSRSSSSSSFVSHDSRASRPQPRRRPSTRKAFREAAVQTHPPPPTWPPGTSAGDPGVGVAYSLPSPAVAYTLRAEVVEALSTFNPAVFALNESLKQQLAMTRRFMESSRQLHSSLVQSLEPPNYRYTTLEDTKEYIRKHRGPKVTMEEALQQMRAHHHVTGSSGCSGAHVEQTATMSASLNL